MIDPAQVISLAKAAKEQPTRRADKPTHISCLYRWTKAGCKGVKLEFIQIGGTRCTSREALARFFARLTAAETGEPVSIRTPAQRERDHLHAEKELEDEGI